MNWKIEENETHALNDVDTAHPLVRYEANALDTRPTEEVLGSSRGWTLDFAALIGLPSSFLAVLASSSLVHAVLTTLLLTSVAAGLGRVMPWMLTRHFRKTPIALIAMASGLGMALMTALPTLLQPHHNLDATGVAATTSFTITSIFTASYIASRALKIRLGPVRFAMPAVFLLGATAGWSLVLFAIHLQQLLH